MYIDLVGWLVGCFGFNYDMVLQSISDRLPERGRKKRKMIDKRKTSKQPPPTPIASAVGSCPTIIQMVLGVNPAPSHHPTTTYMYIEKPVNKLIKHLAQPCKHQFLLKIICFTNFTIYDKLLSFEIHVVQFSKKFELRTFNGTIPFHAPFSIESVRAQVSRL